jgi:uncharacterized protein (TIGR00730 family)
MSKFHKNAIYHHDGIWAAERAKKELEEGLELLGDIKEDIVAFAGSARVNAQNNYYQHCKDIAQTLGKDGYALLSGGGPGIMHAVNSGAKEAGARSIGLKSDLLTKEQITEDIYTNQLSMHYFFTRRFIMLIKTNTYIYYPGGLGTLNELLENMMLMQNDIVDTIPMVCVGVEYWTGLFDWMKANPIADSYMNKFDLDLVQILDSKEEIIKVIHQS